MENFGFKENLRKARKALKKSQGEFAEPLGMTTSSISNLEIGRTKPLDSFFVLVREVYCMNEEWLKTGKGEMFSPAQKAHSNESIEKAITLFAAQNTPEIGDLTDQEKRIIRMFRKLDPERKQRIIDLVTDAFIALRE